MSERYLLIAFTCGGFGTTAADGLVIWSETLGTKIISSSCRGAAHHDSTRLHDDPRRSSSLVWIPHCFTVSLLDLYQDSCYMFNLSQVLTSWEQTIKLTNKQKSHDNQFSKKICPLFVWCAFKTSLKWLSTLIVTSAIWSNLFIL